MTKNESEIEICGEKIKTSPEATYLGVTLDKFLTYKTHIENKNKKRSKNFEPNENGGITKIST